MKRLLCLIFDTYMTILTCSVFFYIYFYLFSQINSNPNQEDWICDLCTFQNKYTQRSCEACTMPFLSAGNHIDYNNSGIFAPMPMQLPSPSPLQSQSMLLPQQSYPLTHYMPMQMPYSLHNNNNHNNTNTNNNNNIPYVHSNYYRPQSLPPQFYVYDTSRF